jgi:uncharacterized SAM-dependent methyltransferase
MKYYKNIEISREYGVNPTTVQNWIDASIAGKNGLQLVKTKKRDYVVNNSHNNLIIENLVESSRKYKHKSQRKEVTAKKEFFETFSDEQIAEIINSIEIHNEIPHKFTYFGQGAELWKKYAERSVQEEIANTITDTDMMLNLLREAIFQESREFDKLNILDIGCGDLTPVKNLLKNLLAGGKIHKYIGFDISPEILKIAQHNLNNWFKSKIDSEYVERDIELHGFDDILFYRARERSDLKIGNLVLFVGSTIENQADIERVISNISHSLNGNDIFLLGITLDTIEAKMYFDLSPDNKDKQEFEGFKNWQNFVVPNLMGLHPSDFDVELHFDDSDNSRKLYLIPNKDLLVGFSNEKVDTKLELIKNQKITAWRHHHHSLEEIVSQLNRHSLTPKHMCTSPNGAHAIVVCKRQ